MSDTPKPESHEPTAPQNEPQAGAGDDALHMEFESSDTMRTIPVPQEGDGFDTADTIIAVKPKPKPTESDSEATVAGEVVEVGIEESTGSLEEAAAAVAAAAPPADDPPIEFDREGEPDPPITVAPKPPAPAPRTAPQPVAAPAPKKKRRWLLKTLVALVLLAAAGLPALLYVVAPSVVKSALRTELSAGGRCEVEVDRIAYTFPYTVEIEGLRVRPIGKPTDEPVLQLVKGTLTLDALPLPNRKLKIQEIRLTPKIMVTENADGTDTLSQWLIAMGSDRAPDKPAEPAEAEKQNIQDVLEIGLLKIEDGVIGVIPYDPKAKVAFELDALTLELTNATSDGRFYNLAMESEIGPLGRFSGITRLDVQDWVLEIPDDPKLTLELTDERLAKLPARIRGLFDSIGLRGRIELKKGKARLPLKDIKAGTYHAETVLTGGAMKSPKAKIDIKSVAGRLTVDHVTGVALDLSGSVNNEPITVNAAAKLIRGIPWSIRAGREGVLSIRAEGAIEKNPAGEDVLGVPVVAGEIDLAKALVVLPAFIDLGDSPLRDAGGKITFEGKLRVNLEHGEFESGDLKVTAVGVNGEVLAAGIRAVNVGAEIELGTGAKRPTSIRLKLDGEQLTIAKADLSLTHLKADVRASSDKGVFAAVSARVRDSDLKVDADIPFDVSGPWRTDIRHGDQVLIAGRGQVDAKAQRLTAESLDVNVPDFAPVLALLPQAIRDEVTARKAEGAFTATGKLAVDLKTSRVSELQIDWKFDKLAADLTPDLGRLRDGRIVGSIKPGLLTLSEVRASLPQADVKLDGAIAFSETMDFAVPLKLQNIRVEARAPGRDAMGAPDAEAQIDGELDPAKGRFAGTLKSLSVKPTSGLIDKLPKAIADAVRPYIRAPEFTASGKVGVGWLDGVKLDADTRIEFRFADTGIALQALGTGPDGKPVASGLLADAGVQGVFTVGPKGGPLVTIDRITASVRSDGPAAADPVLVELDASALFDGDARTISVDLKKATASVSSALLGLLGPQGEAVRKLKPQAGVIAVGKAGWSLEKNEPTHLDIKIDLADGKATFDDAGASVEGVAVSLTAARTEAGGLLLKLTRADADVLLRHAGATEPVRAALRGTEIELTLQSLTADAPVKFAGKLGRSPIGAITLSGSRSADGLDVLVWANLALNDELAALLPGDARKAIDEHKLSGSLPLRVHVKVPATGDGLVEASIRGGRLGSAANDLALTDFACTIRADTAGKSVRVDDLRAACGEGSLRGRLELTLTGDRALDADLIVRAFPIPAKFAGDIPGFQRGTVDGMITVRGVLPPAWKEGPLIELRGGRLTIEHKGEGSDAVRVLSVGDIALVLSRTDKTDVWSADARIGRILGGVMNLEATLDTGAGDHQVRRLRGFVRLTDAGIRTLPMSDKILAEATGLAGTLEIAGTARYRTKPPTGEAALAYVLDAKLRDGAATLRFPATTVDAILADLHIEPEFLRLDRADLRACGGRVKASAQVDLPKEKDGPVGFRGKAEAEGIDLEKLAVAVAEPGKPPRKMAGKAAASAAFAGSLPKPIESLTVEGGTARVRDAQLADVPLFGEILKVARGLPMGLVFKKDKLDQHVDADFDFRDRKVIIKRAEFRDPLIVVDSDRGTIEFVARPAGAEGYDKKFDIAIRLQPLGGLTGDLPLDKLGLKGIDKKLGGVGGVVANKWPFHVGGTSDLPIVLPRVGPGK